MAYLNDIIGLLSLRDRYGLEKGQLDLGREQLAQRAKEFQDSLGLSEREAMRAAQQWQDQFQAAQERKAFEQQQEQNRYGQQLAQQNFQNVWQSRPEEADILRSLLSNAKLDRPRITAAYNPRHLY
jgi:hypothetical protein